jgi:hypothetical protein
VAAILHDADPIEEIEPVVKIVADRDDSDPVGF